MKTTILNRVTPGILLAFCLAYCCTAQAYDVESDSNNNTVYMLLLNDNPGAVYHSITISDSAPAWVDVTAYLIPDTVLGSNSGLAAIAFDVASISAGTTGDLVVTVSGLAAGSPIDVEFTVPLEVVSSAPATQGFVGTGVPTPDPGGTDTDGDGVPDSLEIAFGSDPNSAASIPGQVDTDGDGIEDGSDPAPNDPCIPSAFNASCAQDSDGDGESDFNEGELADADGDGAPDYQESSILDADGDTYTDELDAANNDACIPDVLAPNCAAVPTETVPLIGLPGYLLLALLLSGLAITQTRRRANGRAQS